MLMVIEIQLECKWNGRDCHILNIGSAYFPYAFYFIGYCNIHNLWKRVQIEEQGKDDFGSASHVCVRAECRKC